jgi:hypothetical protein
MVDRAAFRPTFSDVIAVALILWSTGYSVLLINLAGSGAPFAQFLLIVAAVFALRGMYRLKTTGSSIVLWCVIGAHIALGMLAIFSIGLGNLFNAAVLIVYAVFRSRHLGVPVVDRWGLLAEIIGFFAVPILLFLIF